MPINPASPPSTPCILTSRGHGYGCTRTPPRVLPERQQHIKALMGLPENTYNPVFLVEEAQVAIATKNYDQALDKARRAEQHWARLPSSAVFHRKAMIYELQAGAWYGLWGKSGGDDPDALLQSIRSWERYRQHVSRRDPALAARADEQITKLSGLKDRARVEEPLLPSSSASSTPA